MNNSLYQRFVTNKILWFPNGKWMSDNSLMSNLSKQRKGELDAIRKEFAKKSNMISKDVISELSKNQPAPTLLTVMLQYDNKRPKYIGQITEYVKLFKRGVLSKRYNNAEKLVCNLCCKKRMIEVFRETPLPFYFTDKAMFFPEASTYHIKKGFPVCDSCYIKIQRGIWFIRDKLRYSIPSVESAKSDLNFWLIPHLDDRQLIIAFKNDLRKRNLYLNVLKDLCSTLKSISYSYESSDEGIESFLSFSALFFTFDNHALMRVENYIQGIYPSQLQKLVQTKEKIDKMYPFPILSQRISQKYYMGFPLLLLFYKDITPQWRRHVISLLEKIFTGQQIPIMQIIQNINVKIREIILKGFDLQATSQTIFLGLMLLEFLINLNASQENEKTLEGASVTEEIAHIQKFIADHNNILVDENTRSVFAVGICVGVLLYVQEQKFDKVAPYWERLNRLDLNLQRVSEFFPEVKSKLAIYKIRDYDTLINYLGANEISKMNRSISIERETLNLTFSIGLSYGYMSCRGYLK
jgi:CRISPR-associated protein Cas8b/Csh1 subtype I-B